MTQLNSPIGLIAGSGDFPLEFMRAARTQNLEVVVVAHLGETHSAIGELARDICWIKVGQLNKLIKFFKSNGVRQLAILGGIKRSRLFREVWPDWRAVRLLARLSSLKDDSILRGLAAELERVGFQIFSASEILTECLVHRGQLTVRQLSEQEKNDARLAWQAAQAIGALDIGQAAVAFKGTVVALEAVEGTDGMLDRTATLLSIEQKTGAGAVLVKRSKPGQDLRIDLPSVGVETLKKMKQAGVTALVLEAEQSMILTPAEFIELANRFKQAVVIWDRAGE